MSTDFTPFTTPPPPSHLRARVLAAADSHAPEPAPLRVLDHLASSPTWWVSWGSAMALMIVLGGVGRESGAESFTAESWRRYQRSVAVALGTFEVVPAEPDDDRSEGHPGGTA